MDTKVIFFDVANTLLYKPSLYSTISGILERHAVSVPETVLISVHRFLSEVIDFPDKTSSNFYKEFNRNLLRALGVLPTDDLLDDLFSACSYLPWAQFPDTEHLTPIRLPIGILSNWDSSLSNRLTLINNVQFTWVLGSADERVRKPDIAFFMRVLSITGLRAQEIMYIGDSLKLDIEPALHLGMNAVLVDRNQLYPYSNVKRISSLSELEFML